MKNKKALFIAAGIVVVAAVGILLSPLVDWSVDKDKASGDIGKAERLSRLKTEPISNMQELLLNDADYKDGIVASYVVMQTRAQQFAALVEMSNDAACDLEDFADVLSKMNETREMTVNVCKQLGAAGEDLATVLGGEDSPEVEQNTINAALAYTTLQKQNRLADLFIEKADRYLKKNEGSDQLKLARDSWVDYQQMTAALGGDSKAAAALEKKGYKLTPEQSVAAVAGGNLGYVLPMMMSAALSDNLGAANNLSAAFTGDNLNVILRLLRETASQMEFHKNSEALGFFNAARLMLLQAGNTELGAFFDKENLGFFDKEHLGFFDKENLGFFDKENLGFFDKENLAFFSKENLGFFDKTELDAFFDKEKLGFFDKENLGFFDKENLAFFDKENLAFFDKAELDAFFDKAELGAFFDVILMNDLKFFSTEQLTNTFNNIVVSLRSNEAALGSGVSDVISATAMGLRLQDTAWLERK
ncbi:MAG: hypothetical protein J5737_04870 [Bacteroidales bacterium]|nr:hypothetical protein [Bacteroidales bacterium]